MKFINLRDLKEGQIVVVGTLGVGKFEIAEVKANKITFINREIIDMKKGSMVEEDEGYVSHKEGHGGMWVLNSSDLKKAKKIKDKILMLKELSS